MRHTQQAPGTWLRKRHAQHAHSSQKARRRTVLAAGGGVFSQRRSATAKFLVQPGWEQIVTQHVRCDRDLSQLKFLLVKNGRCSARQANARSSGTGTVISSNGVNRSCNRNRKDDDDIVLACFHVEGSHQQHSSNRSASEDAIAITIAIAGAVAGRQTAEAASRAGASQEGNSRAANGTEEGRLSDQSEGGILHGKGNERSQAWNFGEICQGVVIVRSCVLIEGVGFVRKEHEETRIQAKVVRSNAATPRFWIGNDHKSFGVCIDIGIRIRKADRSIGPGTLRTPTRIPRADENDRPCT
mmetsp:Transcript_2357/g.6199  ORF Transcript_2357/g.6199 Transcript_2357/m.6199 type:complete len:299 (-) Transcript_2357:163-1059(-)